MRNVGQDLQRSGNRNSYVFSSSTLDYQQFSMGVLNIITYFQDRGQQLSVTETIMRESTGRGSNSHFNCDSPCCNSMRSNKCNALILVQFCMVNPKICVLFISLQFVILTNFAILGKLFIIKEQLHGNRVWSPAPTLPHPGVLKRLSQASVGTLPSGALGHRLMVADSLHASLAAMTEQEFKSCNSYSKLI